MKTFESVYNFIRPSEAMLYGLKTKDRCLDHWNQVEAVKNIKGNFIEVGVWRGGSASLIASQMKNLGLTDTLFLCDTWSGVPKSKIDSSDLYCGNEHHDATIQQVTRLFFDLKLDDLNIEILEGIFPDETSKLIPENTKFKYVSLDTDIYESTHECFNFLWPNIVSGGIVIIDDYLWPNTPGITKFVNELARKKEFKFEEIDCAKYQYILKKI